MSGRTRLPVAAGRFYPESREALTLAVDELLAEAPALTLAGTLRALVVPHAGYAYSGATAAAAYAALRDDPSRRFALVGPSHFVGVARPVVSGAAAWRTPLGDVVLDTELRERAIAAGAAVGEAPHAQEHSLEVQLPFLQRCAGDGLTVVTVAAASTRSTEVVAALADVSLLVVSTDLSHYLDDPEARRRDRRTADAVLELDDRAIAADDACGAEGLRALLAHARRAGWRCTLLALRTSADATGDRRSVVGYGAFAFTEPPGPGGPPVQSKQMSATTAEA